MNPIQYLQTAQSLPDGGSQNFQGDIVANLKVTQNTYLNPFDAITTWPKGVLQTTVSANGLIYTGSAVIIGYLINSNTAGAVLQLGDATAAATGLIGGTITTTAATDPGTFINMGNLQVNTGAYMNITGVANVTVFYLPAYTG